MVILFELWKILLNRKGRLSEAKPKALGRKEREGRKEGSILRLELHMKHFAPRYSEEETG
jgi:hypothetical protein